MRSVCVGFTAAVETSSRVVCTDFSRVKRKAKANATEAAVVEAEDTMAVEVAAMAVEVEVEVDTTAVAAAIWAGAEVDLWAVAVEVARCLVVWRGTTGNYDV